MWPPGNSVTILKVNSINFIIKIYCRNKKLLNMISIKIKQISPGQRCFSVDFFCKGLWSGMNFLKAHTIIFRTKNRYSMENRNEMSNNTFDYRSNKTIVCAQLFFLPFIVSRVFLSLFGHPKTLFNNNFLSQHNTQKSIVSIRTEKRRNYRFLTVVLGEIGLYFNFNKIWKLNRNEKILWLC